MQRSFILPPAFCRFIQSLEPPAPEPQPRADEWPEPDNPTQSQPLPPMYPQPRAWQVARDAFISHLMACPVCVAHSVKVPRYCPEGDRLHQQYESTPTISPGLTEPAARRRSKRTPGGPIPYPKRRELTARFKRLLKDGLFRDYPGKYGI